MKTQIFKSEFQAHRAAKSYFESLFNVKNCPVKIDKYLMSRHNSTSCCCGETSGIYFEPVELNKKRMNIIEQNNINLYTGTSIFFGVCESCGENY